jgi:hypothetical protein
MTGMVRNDGDYVVYIIKHRCNTDHSWAKSNMDRFSFAGDEEFGASGACWQSTSINGTFDRAKALAALTAIAEAYPDYEFGIFEVKISQHSRPIGTMSLASA